MEDIDSKILDLVKKNAPSFNNVILSSETNLFEEGFLDSFAIVQLISEIENVFCVQIDSENLSYQNFSTLTDLSKLIKNILATK